MDLTALVARCLTVGVSTVSIDFEVGAVAGGEGSARARLALRLLRDALVGLSLDLLCFSWVTVFLVDALPLGFELLRGLEALRLLLEARDSVGSE